MELSPKNLKTQRSRRRIGVDQEVMSQLPNPADFSTGNPGLPANLILTREPDLIK